MAEGQGVPQGTPTTSRRYDDRPTMWALEAVGRLRAALVAGTREDVQAAWREAEATVRLAAEGRA